MGRVIAQIALINLVFSFDSILTAIGLTDLIAVMMVAVMASVLVMMAFSGPIAAFIERHPTFQVLALSFLILIGFTLIVEAVHLHVAKGYVYFAVAFALGVELVNLRVRRRAEPVQLHARYTEAED
jgi:predicted tellurium resistance membrane protein TerC